MLELIGAEPRPRVLVFGGDGIPVGVVEELRRLVPTVHVVDTSGVALPIRQKSYDAAVIFGQPGELEQHLYVIQFGGGYCGEPQLKLCIGHLEASETTVSREFLLPEHEQRSLGALVRSDLLPAVMQERQNAGLRLRVTQASGTAPGIHDIVDAFLLDADGLPLAGRYTRRGGLAQCWWLPDGVQEPGRWIAAALEAWRVLDESRFPSEAEWYRSPAWQTPAERAVQDALVSLEKERADAIAAIADQEAVLTKELAEARASADMNERRLLTAQGSALCAEVKNALEELGFYVADVDATSASKGDLLEDLQVTDPDEPDWLALVEVRGYAKGAQVTDLLRIGRFVARFAQGHHRVPPAWYIVNHDIGSDPASRPRALASNPQELEAFGKSGGLVLDTIELFKLRMAVRTGQVGGSDLRTMLRFSTGLLNPPGADTGVETS